MMGIRITNGLEVFTQSCYYLLNSTSLYKWPLHQWPQQGQHLFSSIIWLCHAILSFIYSNKQCIDVSYNTVNFLQNPHDKHIIACPGVQDTGCGKFKLWSMFWFSNNSAVCNIISYWTMFTVVPDCATTIINGLYIKSWPRKPSKKWICKLFSPTILIPCCLVGAFDAMDLD